LYALICFSIFANECLWAGPEAKSDSIGKVEYVFSKNFL